MQNLYSSHSNVRMTLAAVCICSLALSGCSTTKKVADAASPTSSTQVGAKGLQGRGAMLAKEGMLTKDSVVAKPGMSPSSLHMDPVASRTSARQATQSGAQSLTSEQAAALLGSTPAAAPAAENAFPPAPAPVQQQASISGLATQPTGVRADSGTIFSSNPPMPAATTGATGPVPADLPRRNFNAVTASVFSAPQPMPAASCGTDAQGNPLSC